MLCPRLLLCALLLGNECLHPCARRPLGCLGPLLCSIKHCLRLGCLLKLSHRYKRGGCFQSHLLCSCCCDGLHLFLHGQ